MNYWHLVTGFIGVVAIILIKSKTQSNINFNRIAVDFNQLTA